MEGLIGHISVAIKDLKDTGVVNPHHIPISPLQKMDQFYIMMDYHNLIKW